MNTYAYDESGRRRWVLVGGAVLAIVALLVIGIIIGRSTAPASGGGRAQVVNTQSGPGPTHVVNGVPVGYAHTQAGAVAAATNFLETFYGQLVFQSDQYHAAVAEMAAPDSRNALTKLASGNLTDQQTLISYAAQGRAVIDRLVPLAYRVESFNNDSAQISIWAETFVAVDGALSLRDGWTTTKVTCQWVSNDWRLSDIPASPGPEGFGPVPTPIQAASQSTNLPPQLGNYRSYRLDAT